MRVRLSIVDRSLLLHTLSDRLIASWSLDRLENREVLGESPLVIANLRTPIWYSKATETIRSFAKSLLDCVPSALVQLGFAVTESGNQRGAPVFWLLLIGVGSLVVWLFRQLSQL